MMIELANRRRLAMRGMSKRAAFRYLETIVADAEVVIGIWQDASEPNSVGLHVIKGLWHLMTNTASGEPARVRVDAVPCIDREQPVAAGGRGSAINPTEPALSEPLPHTLAPPSSPAPTADKYAPTLFTRRELSLNLHRYQLRSGFNRPLLAAPDPT
jgi:hypothetical protein